MYFPRPPSPVKSTPESRIPTPTGNILHRGSSEPNLSICRMSSVEIDGSSQSLFLVPSNENDFGFGEQLQELLMPSSPIRWSDEHIEEILKIDDDVLSINLETRYGIPSKNSNVEAFNNEVISKEPDKQEDDKEGPNLKDLKPDANNTKQVTTSGMIQGEEKNKSKGKPKESILYISESFIKKIAKCVDLSSIKSLNLSVYKQHKRKIKFIENLGNLMNLECLNLSNNLIYKIQNMQSLAKLRELDLSQNKINKFDGVEVLVTLEKLNVSYNEISSIPSWFENKMLGLKVLKMNSNNLKKIQEIKKLSMLSNLTEVEMKDNPCSLLDHFFEFVVFNLRTVNMLNSQSVTREKRNNADLRFSLSKVARKDQEILELKDENEFLNKIKFDSDKEREILMENEKKLSEKLRSIKKSLHLKSEELKMKTDLLNSKTTELNKACEKQYKLEQELAFHKLDAKFDEMWHMCEEDTNENETIVLHNFEENPYIGKARYKPNSMAKENIILTEEQCNRFACFFSRLNHNELRKNSIVMTSLEKALSVDKPDCFNVQESELNSQVELLKDTIHELEKKIDSCKMELNVKENSLHARNDQLVNYDEEGSSEKVELENDGLLSRLNKLHVLLDDANTELINCYQKIGELENKHEEVDSFNEKKHKMEQQILMLQQQLEKDTNIISKLTAENDNLVDDYKKLSEIKNNGDKKLKVLEVNLKQHENVLNRLKDENRDLCEQITNRQNNDVRALLMENQTLKEKCENIARECELQEQDKIKERREVLDFVNTLAFDLQQGKGVLCDDTESQSLKSAFVNLKNVAMNQQNHSNKIQIEDFEYMQTENLHLKDEIKMLKEKLDCLESTERMKSHELNVLKNESKTSLEENLQTIKEYDEIASEMRNHLESLEEKQKVMKKELQRKEQQIAKERKNNKKLQENILKQEKISIAKNEELNDEIAQLEEIKIKMENALKISKEETSSMEKRSKAIEEKFQQKLTDQAEEHKSGLKKLLDDICLTKQYIQTLQDDVNTNIISLNSHVKSLQQAATNIEAVLKETHLEHQQILDLKNKLKNIKSNLNDVSDDLHLKDCLRDVYRNVSERIVDLENRINSKEINDEQNGKNVDEKLTQALHQIENVENLLEEKQQDLDSSDIPTDLISLQQKEISNLLGQLNEKERNLRKLQPKEISIHRKRSSVSKRDLSSSFQHNDSASHDPYTSHDPYATSRHCNARSTRQPEEPHVIYHEHYFGNNANNTLSENIRSNMTVTVNSTAKNNLHRVERETLRLEQGRDDLRYELNRLEAKVGDAMLHRSMYRKRYPHY